MFLVGNILLPGKQILFPQQCFHGCANVETFEEASRITNVLVKVFPSLPMALGTLALDSEHEKFDVKGHVTRCKFSCNLQCNSTLERCSLVKSVNNFDMSRKHQRSVMKTHIWLFYISQE
jgi:hypothetical protein